jgi:hypothetical protein
MRAWRNSGVSARHWAIGTREKDDALLQCGRYRYRITLGLEG